MKFALKPISKHLVRAALEKAKHYRLLNEPRESESICEDILAVEPDNQDARITLLLALTDQVPDTDAEHRAWELIKGLPDDYHREYYAGILCERKAKGQHERHVSPHVVYAGLRRAMDHFERAIAHAPADNEDAVLRWNTCARIIMRFGLEPEAEGFRPYGD